MEFFLPHIPKVVLYNLNVGLKEREQHESDIVYFPIHSRIFFPAYIGACKKWNSECLLWACRETTQTHWDRLPHQGRNNASIVCSESSERFPRIQRVISTPYCAKTLAFYKHATFSFSLWSCWLSTNGKKYYFFDRMTQREAEDEAFRLFNIPMLSVVKHKINKICRN